MFRVSLKSGEVILMTFLTQSESSKSLLYKEWLIQLTKRTYQSWLTNYISYIKYMNHPLFSLLGQNLTTYFQKNRQRNLSWLRRANTINTLLNEPGGRFYISPKKASQYFVDIVYRIIIITSTCAQHSSQ